MTDIVDPYVASRAKLYRQWKAKQDSIFQAKLDELRDTGVATLSREDLYAIFKPNEVFYDVAYGLDEAVAALQFYSNPSTWEEVPAKTLAADDRGQKAAVALARINPV